ncbi:hypothetical protein F4703DRAFT_1925019 [Phycomyces blakesleeanus]
MNPTFLTKSSVHVTLVIYIVNIYVEEHSSSETDFTVLDDEQLCRSYIHVAYDSENPCEQDSDELWQRIAKHYLESSAENAKKRTISALSYRWDCIGESVTKYHEILTRLREEEAGGSEDESNDSTARNEMPKPKVARFGQSVDDFDDEEVEEEAFSTRSVKTGLENSQESAKRKSGDDIEKFFLTQKELMRRGDERTEYLKESILLARKKLKIEQEHTLAIEKQTAVLRKSQDIQILFMNPLSIENLEDREILLEEQREIRKRGVGKEPTSIFNKGDSNDAKALDSN